MDNQYLSGYLKLRPVDGQIAELKKWVGPYLDLRFDWRLNEQQQQLLTKPTPKDCLGYAAVVFDPIMITHYEADPKVDQSSPVTRILEALKQCNKHIINYLKAKLGSAFYHRSKQSVERMTDLWESQGCPTGLLLIPVQLRLSRIDYPASWTRAVICANECPLDAYEVLQIVLTNENRLQHYNNLWIDLPGGRIFPTCRWCF